MPSFEYFVELFRPIHPPPPFQLAELAIKYTGSKSKIINLPLPGDDPQQRKPDITKAKK